MENEPQKKNKPFWHLIVIVLAVSAVFVIARPALLRWAAAPSPVLDYDAVLRAPNAFKGEAARVEGRLVGFLPAGADTDYTFLLVEERADSARRWVLYGDLNASEVSAIADGMNVQVDGMCAGLLPLEYGGMSASVPALFFAPGTLKYGWQP